MPARILIFWPPGDFSTSSGQLTERYVQDDFEGWLERRKKTMAVFGTVNPEPYFHPRLGTWIEPLPPENPSTLPVGPARESADCLKLVHRYSKAEWEKVQQVHREVWARFIEEERKRKEAELAARPPAPPEPETRWSWGKRYKAAVETKKGEKGEKRTEG